MICSHSGHWCCIERDSKQHLNGTKKRRQISINSISMQTSPQAWYVFLTVRPALCEHYSGVIITRLETSVRLSQNRQLSSIQWEALNCHTNAAHAKKQSSTAERVTHLSVKSCTSGLRARAYSVRGCINHKSLFERSAPHHSAERAEEVQLGGNQVTDTENRSTTP